MYGLDIFNHMVVSEAATARLAQSDRPAAQLAGELLRIRRGRLIGDAGRSSYSPIRHSSQSSECRPARAARCRTRPELDRSGRAEYRRRDRCGCGSGRAANCRCTP
jgi:hypothetical protein